MRSRISINNNKDLLDCGPISVIPYQCHSSFQEYETLGFSLQPLMISNPFPF